MDWATNLARGFITLITLVGAALLLWSVFFGKKKIQEAEGSDLILPVVRFALAALLVALAIVMITGNSLGLRLLDRLMGIL